MKNFVIQTSYNGKSLEFDTREEAIKAADKRQKTRKSAVVVLEKCGETEEEYIYKECYNARGGKLATYKYSFQK